MSIRLFSLIIVLLNCSLILNGQVVYLKTSPSSLHKAYQKAISLYKSNQYPKAQKSFEKILKNSPHFIDANLILGSIHFDQNNFEQAEYYFRKVITLDSLYIPKVFYTLSICNYSNQHFSDAHQNIKTFLRYETKNQELISKAKRKLINYQFADSATRNPVVSHPVSVTNINSDFSEYLPSLTADGRTMVFTRKINNDNEDLFISYLQDNGSWTTPVDIVELNTEFNEGAPAISPDGNTLVFVSCDRRESYGGCDLYVSYKTDKGWGIAANFGDKINSPAYETQPCFSDNGKVLLFTSNRVGGYGGRDIWMSIKNKNNSWVAPFNVGPDINTTDNEECPFLHPDGKTLFFCSDGHPGMGKKDIFMSRMKNFTSWSTPINIGYPINSPFEESSFVAYSNGKKALMASDKNFLGIKDKTQLDYINLDIYEFDIPEFVQPIPSCYYRFQVIDAITQKPIQALTEIYRLNDKKVFFTEKLDPSGKKQIAIPGNDEYFISVTHPDYHIFSDKFLCYSNITFSSQTQKISLIPIEKAEKPIILKNVLFEFSSARLKEESFFELDKLVNQLKEKTLFKIHIIGHTDNVGSDIDNLLLSQLRAESVAQYLKTNGINKSRITSEGKGEKEAITTNDTEAGRALNRRTEFILKKSE